MAFRSQSPSCSPSMALRSTDNPSSRWDCLTMGNATPTHLLIFNSKDFVKIPTFVLCSIIPHPAIFIFLYSHLHTDLFFFLSEAERESSSSNACTASNGPDQQWFSGRSARCRGLLESHPPRVGSSRRLKSEAWWASDPRHFNTGHWYPTQHGNY